MPRTKGSKNKVKHPIIAVDYVAELDKKYSEKNTLESGIAAVEADIDGLKILLKEKKTILKKINKEIAGLEDKKRQQDEAALKKAQKEQISIAIQQLLDTGVSMDDVLSRLKG